MTAHERALDLGAAAFDFGLVPADRDALERHLESCLQCRSDLDGMADDARRLGSRPVHWMSPERAGAVRASLVRPRRAVSPAMVFVTAALLLLLGIAAAAVGGEVARRLGESRLAVVPVPTTVPSPGSTETPVAPMAWELTDLGRTPGIPFQATAVADAGGTWTAVGTPECVTAGAETHDCVAPVARSVDGRTWSLSAAVPVATRYVPVTSGPLPGVVDIATDPDGLVAVGYARHGAAKPVMGIPDGSAWWSADGQSWERIPLGDGARPRAVFRATDRWLIGGVVYRDGGPIGAIWTSPDGRTWTLLEDADAFDVGGYVDTMEDPASGGIGAFASNGDGLVAGGQVCAGSGLPCVAAAWTSVDGTTWERSEPMPSGDAIENIVAVNDAFVATARRCTAGADCATVMLRSTDGLAWEAVPGEPAPQGAMVATDDTIVLVTGAYRTLDVRASADGAAWTSLGSVPAPERVNWGAPVLVVRPDGVIDLLIRVDPLDPQESEADVWTALWEIAQSR